MLLILFLLICALQQHLIQAYIIQPRFGHSAVLVNDSNIVNSIYFYGGDSSVSSAIKNSSEWLSELSILPIHSPYPLTDPPWKPASGPQDSIGGPPVYSHIAFMGGTNHGNMIVIGGVMPQTDQYTTDEEPTAYSYDCDLGRWNSFSLPSGNHLNRQGAASTATDHGITYIWGGKRTITNLPSPVTASLNISSRPVLSASMYRFDSIFPENSSVVLSEGLSPPLRYAHTQTLISDHKIVILGGFDSATGEPIPLSDVWVYDIRLSVWNQINATLDVDKKPDARSSHSQVLMSDGFSILVYGGYDGYHVYNDVAVLDTRTWTWTVKNTNAAVQGRADHTASLVGTNMIVAFGFTGVSTALTVMADIEVLDTLTWSWTSVYTPTSSHYNTGGTGKNPNNGITGGNVFSNSNGPSTPSVAIIAGAVIGGLVVFLLILVAFYLLHRYHQKQRNQTKNDTNDDECSNASSLYTISPQTTRLRLSNLGSPLQQLQLQQQQQRKYHQQLNKHHEMLEIKFRDPPSSTEPFEYFPSSYRRPSNQIPHPLQINTSNLPIQSDTNGTSASINSSVFLLPSPWTPIQTKLYKQQQQEIISSPSSVSTSFGFNMSSCHSPSLSSSTFKFSDWVIRRAASTPTQQYHHRNHHRKLPLQTPESKVSKPDDKFYPPVNQLRRAATICEPTNSNNISIRQYSQVGNAENDEDALFDRQEFILESDQVAKIEIPDSKDTI